MAVSSRSKDLSGRSWSVEWQPGDLDSPLIFHRRGTRVGDFRKRWKKACGAAGVSGRLLYDLRRTAIGTMALAGTRPGEALALQAGDVDLAGLTVQIERTVDKRGHVGVPKDGERRTVDLHPLLVPALKRVIRGRKEDTLKWGQRWDEAAALFTTRTGRPFDLANLANAFKRTLKAATPDGQDPPRHSLYDLRHTYATTLLAKRAPITYVAAQMGHANAATTLRYYAHWLPRTGGRYVELLLATPAEGGEGGSRAMSPARS